MYSFFGNFKNVFGKYVSIRFINILILLLVFVKGMLKSIRLKTIRFEICINFGLFVRLYRKKGCRKKKAKKWALKKRPFRKKWAPPPTREIFPIARNALLKLCFFSLEYR